MDQTTNMNPTSDPDANYEVEKDYDSEETIEDVNANNAPIAPPSATFTVNNRPTASGVSSGSNMPPFGTFPVRNEPVAGATQSMTNMPPPATFTPSKELVAGSTQTSTRMPPLGTFTVRDNSMASGKQKRKRNSTPLPGTSSFPAQPGRFVGLYTMQPGTSMPHSANFATGDGDVAGVAQMAQAITTPSLSPSDVYHPAPGGMQNAFTMPPAPIVFPVHDPMISGMDDTDPAASNMVEGSLFAPSTPVNVGGGGGGGGEQPPANADQAESTVTFADFTITGTLNPNSPNTTLYWKWEVLRAARTHLPHLTTHCDPPALPLTAFFPGLIAADVNIYRAFFVQTTHGHDDPHAPAHPPWTASLCTGLIADTAGIRALGGDMFAVRVGRLADLRAVAYLRAAGATEGDAVMWLWRRLANEVTWALEMGTGGVVGA